MAAKLNIIVWSVGSDHQKHVTIPGWMETVYSDLIQGLSTKADCKDFSSLYVSKSTKLFHPGLLSTLCSDAAERNDLHRRLFHGVPAVVPCDPNDAVVIAEFSRVLLCVSASWRNMTQWVQACDSIDLVQKKKIVKKKRLLRSFKMVAQTLWSEVLWKRCSYFLICCR